MVLWTERGEGESFSAVAGRHLLLSTIFGASSLGPLWDHPNGSGPFMVAEVIHESYKK